MTISSETIAWCLAGLFFLAYVKKSIACHLFKKALRLMTELIDITVASMGLSEQEQIEVRGQAAEIRGMLKR